MTRLSEIEERHRKLREEFQFPETLLDRELNWLIDRVKELELENNKLKLENDILTIERNDLQEYIAEDNDD